MIVLGGTPAVKMSSFGQLAFTQANLQHCRAAAATMCRSLGKAPNTIALIQEPWLVKSRVAGMGNLNGSVLVASTTDKPRTCIYVPAGIQASLLPQFSSRDLTSVNLGCDLGNGKVEIIVTSFYLPQDSSEQPPSDEMGKLVQHCEARKIHLIAGGDANAHHTLWGSDSTNSRRKSIVEFLSTTKLEILNCGTFVTAHSQTVIDITLASWDISKHISGWHVSTEASLSDHRWIIFYLKIKEVGKTKYRNPRQTDRNKFNEILLHRLESADTNIRVCY